MGHQRKLGLAGGCGARAVSRKTPIYFIELNIFEYIYIQAEVLILSSFCGSVDGSDGYKSPCHSS